MDGSQSLVRVKLPGCFTLRRVFCLEDPEFNRDWMTEAISEPESMELAAIWLILRLRANQTVDPGLAPPVWYPAQLLGYSTQTLTDRFNFLKQQAQRELPSMDQTFRMLECFVKAGQIRSHLTLKRTTKRKLAREASRKGPPAKQPRAGVAQSSHLRSEDSVDALMFEVRVRDFMSNAVKYASEASQISNSINMASQQAQAEQLALRILSSCTMRDTPPPGGEMPGPSASIFPSPMVSQGILPYDDSEGLNEEEARLASGRVMIVAGRQLDGTGSNNVEGQSDTVSLGTGCCVRRSKPVGPVPGAHGRAVGRRIGSCT